ncbi:MAG: transposase [Candidatus Moraniibacteriota bacterium]|nr:MAG: transposase [Candidatus Moranbacteria bacterium]
MKLILSKEWLKYRQKSAPFSRMIRGKCLLPMKCEWNWKLSPEKAWLKKGERTIVHVNRKREAQSYLGLLNQKNFRCHLYEVPWQNQEEILKALEQFLKEYPDKKICIVWDNARFHKGREYEKPSVKEDFSRECISSTCRHMPPIIIRLSMCGIRRKG